MLYEFLKNNYKEAEPIFFSDIVIKGITKSAVNQQLKKLCNEGKLQKYENGIYYLPKKSRLKTSVGSPFPQIPVLKSIGYSQSASLLHFIIWWSCYSYTYYCSLPLLSQLPLHILPEQVLP